MTERPQTDKPRIFISYAWADKALVRRIEEELETTEVELWVDHSGIRGGDNLPKRISDALEWCNTLLLVWSEEARKSPWVELEWTNAISLGKAIIPCKLDTTKLPGILSSRAYLNFYDVGQGIVELRKALNLAQQSVVTLSTSPAEEVASILHNQFTTVFGPSKPKPPKFTASIPLRSHALDEFSYKDVKNMLRKEKDFFHAEWNKLGKEIDHQYKINKSFGINVIQDKRFGLTWLQYSSEKMKFDVAESYLQRLNAEKFGGFDDWRVPTLEEAMSLMERKKHNGWYINSNFEPKANFVWTVDQENKKRPDMKWVADYFNGVCSVISKEYECNLLVVRGSNYDDSNKAV